MSELQSRNYQVLFEVRLLHHYWLDEGATAFDRIADQEKKSARLQEYDRRSFLSVRPAMTTERTLAACQCLFRDTALGFVVIAPGNALIPPETLMEFIVTVKDSRFFDYTALTLRPQRIYEFPFEPENSIYRFKENVPFLSNLTGTSRSTGAGKALYLSQEYPASDSDDQVEYMVLSEGSPVQLASDRDGANTTIQGIDAQTDSLLVYLHQGDVPPITAPAGMAGAPEKGVRLSSDISDDVYAYLSLAAVCPADSDFSYLGADGKIKSTPPVYQVRIKNRSTYWRYISLKTGAEAVEATPLPLTHFGNASGTKKKPSDSLVRADKNDTKIARLVSDILV